MRYTNRFTKLTRRGFLAAVAGGAAGFAYLESKRYANALSDFTEAIQLKPDPRFYRNRAATWEAAGQHANAIQDTEQANQLERSR